MSFTSTSEIDPYRIFAHADDRLSPQWDVAPSAAMVFNQPSTRTRTAFELASKQLGVTTVSHFGGTSAQEKGESLQDMVSVLSTMVDVVVVRDDYAADLSGPVINAGSANDHPTQALTDLWVMRQKGLLRRPTAIAWPHDRRPRVMNAFECLARRMGVPIVGLEDEPEVLYVSRESAEWYPDLDDCWVLHPGPWTGEVDHILESDKFLGWHQAAASPLIKKAVLRCALLR